MVTDFRQLNEVTVGNSYPLPLTSDMIDAVATAKYITAIDLKTGFYQIPMDPDDAHRRPLLDPTDTTSIREWAWACATHQLPSNH